MKRYVQIAAMTGLALVFGAAGLAKLTNPAMFQDQFAGFGLPGWFIFVTGAAELAAAALVASFNQALRRFGAATIAVTMAVATSLHLIHDPPAMALPAFALMVIAGYVSLVPLGKGARQGPADA